MPLHVGADATRTPRGIVAVSVLDGHLHEVRLHPSLDAFLGHLREADVAACVIDLPIGHDDPDGAHARGRRRTDVAARRFVGPRDDAVPLIPPFLLFTAATHEEAVEEAERTGWPAPGARHWAVRDRILRLQQAVRDHPWLHEGNAEVSFRALQDAHGDGGPLVHPPHYWSGLHERLVLLHEVGLRPTRSFGGIGRMNPEDVVAATALAWSAGRIAERKDLRFPGDAPSDSPMIRA